jgi:hypothetical protein
MMRISTAIVAALVCAAPPLWAADIDNIGNAGQIVIGAERLTGVFVDHVETKATVTQGGATATSEATVDTTTVALFGTNATTALDVPRLALDFFVTKGLSIGGSFIYITRSGESELTLSATGVPSQSEKQDVGPDSVFVIAPRIGYAYAFDETIAIWPRVGFSYASQVSEDKTDTTDANGNPITITDTTTFKHTNLTLEALLVVSPFSHFALAGGPFYDVGLGGSVEFETDDPSAPATLPDADYKASAFGFTVGILAYF